MDQNAVEAVDYYMYSSMPLKDLIRNTSCFIVKENAIVHRCCNQDIRNLCDENKMCRFPKGKFLEKEGQAKEEYKKCRRVTFRKVLMLITEGEEPVIVDNNSLKFGRKVQKNNAEQ